MVGFAEIETVRRSLLNRSTVVLVGTAGIGKSYLIERVTETIPHVIGQSLPALADYSYRPLVNAMRLETFSGDTEEIAAEIVERLGEKVLVLEDIHWADPFTLSVVDSLVGKVPILVSTRDGSELSARPEVVKLVVSPMSRRSALALVRKTHPHLDANRVKQLIEIAAGNPLLLKSLPDANSSGISPTVHEAIMQRVARLPSRSVDALRRLALHGRPAGPDLVGLEDVSDSGGLITADKEGISVWFQHDSYLSPVLDGLSSATRQRLLRDLVRACPDVDAARHLLELGDRKSAVEAALRAATAAGANDRADLFTLILSVLGQEASPLVRLEAARAFATVGRNSEALQAARLVSTTDPALLAERAIVVLKSSWSLGAEREGLHEADLCLAEISGRGGHSEVKLIVERAGVLVRSRAQDPETVEVAKAALAMAQAAGSHIGSAHGLLGVAYMQQAVSACKEHLEIAIAIARQEGDYEAEAIASYWLVTAYLAFGPFEAAVELIDTQLERTAETGNRGWYFHFVTTALVASLTANQPVHDIAGLHQRLIREAPTFRNRTQADLALIVFLINRERLEDARAALAAAERFARTGDDHSLLLLAELEIALATNNTEALKDAVIAASQLETTMYAIQPLCLSAAVYGLIGKQTDFEIPPLNTMDAPSFRVANIEREALEAWNAGDPDTAIGILLRVAKLWTDLGASRLASRALVGAAELACERKPFQKAKEMVALAARSCAPSDIDLNARRLEAILRRLSQRRVLEVLTTREFEVLARVGAGATSRQIAYELGIGAVTVDQHVKSAMAKLKCPTRARAAAMVTGAEVFDVTA